tara:strand:+ start:47 stop:559 length:513 start_codon:yes stop_codon:yes gene_type:complete
LSRKNKIKRSNNADNPNQNICALAVAEAFGVADDVRYLHVRSDTIRALRKKYTVRKRDSFIKKLKFTTVNQLIKGVNKLDRECQKERISRKEYWCPTNHVNWTEKTIAWDDPLGFVVFTKGHVLAIKKNWKEGRWKLIDTAYRPSNKCRVHQVYMVGQVHQYKMEDIKKD